MTPLLEVFEYPLSHLDPVLGDHLDPPSLVVYDTLVTKGPDGTPRPALASDWTVSPDGTRWSFRIRDGARFHSGRVCDAHAVVDALELTRWLDGAPRQVWYWDAVDHVTADDPVTVTFHLRHPSARLPALVWGAHTAIVDSEVWHTEREQFGRTVAAGTGPYRLVSYDPAEVVVERVDSSEELPSRIVWRSVPDDAARMEIVRRGDADIVRYVDALPSDAAPGWELLERPENSQFYLALDFRDPRGFGDVRFRRSVEAFVDRDAIVSAAMGGRGDARRSPIPIADEYAGAYDPRDLAPLSREEAAQTLTELGWAPGGDGVLERDRARLSIDCVAQDTAVSRRLSKLVREQLMAAGIELRLRYLPLFEPFYRAVEVGPEAFISKWLWSDATEAVYGFCRTDCTLPAGGNWQAATTTEVDARFDTFLGATTTHDLGAAAREVQRQFMLDLPYIPLAAPMETAAVGPRAHGLAFDHRTVYPSYDGLR